MIKNIFLVAILTFVTTISFAGPSKEAFRAFMKVATKTEQLTPVDVKGKIIKSIDQLDGFSLFSREKVIPVHAREFGDGAAIRISTYERKSNAQVFVDEQQEQIHLRIEMKDMDYSYVGKLRQALPEVTINDVSNGNSITTIVETNIFNGAKDEVEMNLRLDRASLALSDIYADILKKHTSSNAVFSRKGLNVNPTHIN